MPTALIVDDQSENRYLLECLLSANGFKVIAACNGREALDQAQAQLPDIVLSDILMPVMDGFSLCREWKQSERLRSVPFVFYTATYTDPKDEQFALSLGADLFVVKPAEPDELIRLLQQLLAQRGSGTLAVKAPPQTDETPYLRQYNEVLIRKLEGKLAEVEKANQGLMIKQFAIESSKAGIAMANLEGCITYANAAFVKFWGMASGSESSADLTLLFPDASAKSRVLEQLRADRHWVGPVVRQTGELPAAMAQVEIHLVVNPTGTPLCHMITSSDITEQEQMRLELQRSQRLESLSQFAAGIAHDFNNLLTVIFSGLNLAALEGSQSGSKPPQSYVLNAFTRAKDLTFRLMRFGKGGNLQRRLIHLNSLIEESCAFALSGSGIGLSLEVSPSLWSVHANATELSQVFCNIIINARQAMADSGTLQISAENFRMAGSDASGLAPGDYVRLRFSDSGPGIDPHLLSRIFEPYFTSKAQGSGLGLAMSHAIVTNHGGRLTARSSDGAGASFEIVLPASDKPVLDSIAPPAPHLNRGSGTILWMDDNEQLCRLTALLLLKQGYSVTSAHRGEQAIELYRTAKSSRPFDLVVLDLTVQGGMGGFDTLARLRELDAQVVALACSGYTDEETSLRVTQAGFHGLLGKPFLAHELYSAVQTAIAARVG